MPRIDLTFSPFNPFIQDNPDVIDKIANALPKILGDILKFENEAWTEVRIHRTDPRNVNSRPISIEIFVSRTIIDAVKPAQPSLRRVRDYTIERLRSVIPEEFQGGGEIGVLVQFGDGAYDTM